MIRVGLASYRFVNNDIEFNLSQIQKAMEFLQGKADLLCFGEAFLQGFDALSWNFDIDRNIAVTQNSEVICKLCDMTVRYGVDLLLGYIENHNNSIYSSCIVIEKGKIIHNYRRISKGWKEPIADAHYKEGIDTREFLYHDRYFQIALCGDMWDFPEKFKTENVLIWSIYVNFKLEECENEYAKQAGIASKRVLMINSISESPISNGGAFYFAEGRIKEKADYDKEKILIVEV